MNGSQLSESLRAFSELTGDRALHVIAGAFAEAGDESTSKIVTKIVKYWKATGRVDAYPSGLRERLTTIEQVLQRSGAAASAKDYAALLTLFAGARSIDIGQFVDELITAVRTPVPQKPKPVKTPPVADVRQLADRLTTLSSDNDAFDVEVAAIEGNAKIKKADLQKIATQYLGYERIFKKRDDIIKAIRARQLQDAIQGSRDRRGEKIAV